MTTEPIITPTRELRKLLPEPRFSGFESANTPGERAIAEMRTAIAKLEQAEEEIGSDKIMFTARDASASLLQSAIAEETIKPSSLAPLATGGFEARFDTGDWSGWATVAWAKLKNIIPHPLVRPKSNDAASFPDEAKVGLVGDWATGLYGAPVIAKTIAREKERYEMLIHLGDVYYSGTDKEVDDRFLKLWPSLSGVRMRALNGNHEMYSGGQGYFKKILPAFDQDASYFAFQNSHWTLIGLDVAHKDHEINEPDFHNQQLNWLEGILAKAEKRKVIFLSHHQLYSHYESQGEKLWAERRFRKVLESQRVFAWYWGHEHRCCIYEKRDPRSGIWARCFGHGGMPESRKKTFDLPKAAEMEAADWRRVEARSDLRGNTIPPALILEGDNPFLGDEASKFLPQGYGTLLFDGPKLTEQVRNCTGEVILEKQLAT